METAFIAGLEKGVCTVGITFFANPTEPHSDTDGLRDDEDAEPLTPFDSIFELSDYTKDTIEFLPSGVENLLAQLNSEYKTKADNRVSALLYLPTLLASESAKSIIFVPKVIDSRASTMPNASEFFDTFFT